MAGCNWDIGADIRVARAQRFGLNRALVAPGIVKKCYTRVTFIKGFKSRLSTKAALFHRCFSMQNNREVTKKKAALSTKKPRSVPGLSARVQHSRAAFDKGGFISPLFFNAKQPRGHKKIKPLFQQKSRDPCQA
jgi:hypothetical protein